MQLIKAALKQLLQDMDSGNTNINEEQQQELLSLLLQFNSKDLSKIESAEYIGVSRATFDNYIKKGLLPKGHKRPGFKELSWNKSDLDEFLEKEKYYVWK